MYEVLAGMRVPDIRIKPLAEPGTAPAKPLPGVRQLPAHALATSRLPFGDASGDEGPRRLVVADGCQAELLLCDQRVLVLAEQILQRLGVVDEALVGSASGRRELSGVPRSLELDAKTVHCRIGRLLSEARDGLRKSPELLPRDALETNALDSGCEPQRQSKSREEQPVVIAVQDRKQIVPRQAALVVELCHE